jgi:hypothetical protein
LNSNNETAISSKEWDIDLLTQKAIASNFDERLIGKHLVSLARGGGGVDKAIGYAAIIAKAIATRQRHKK